MQHRFVAPLLVAVLALGFWVRAQNHARIRDGDHIQAADGDSYYHLRRIEQTLQRGFSVPMFDPWLSYPDGQRIQWHGGYDLLVAGLVAVGCGTRPERACMEEVAVWSTPALGTLAILLVFALGRSLGGPGAGLAAALLFAIYPYSAGSARLGHVDHHVLEPLLLAGWLLALAGGRHLLVGVLFGVALACFPSALWPIAVTASALLVDRLRCLRHRHAQDFGLVRTLAAALLVALPVVLTSAFPDRFEPAATSLLHLAALGGGLLVALGVELCARPGLPSPARAATLWVCCAGLAGVAATAIAVPQAGALLRFGDAAGLWTGVVQQVPLSDSPLAIALLIAIVGGACAFVYRRGLRLESPESPAMRVVAMATGVLVLVGLVQIRFLMVASAGLCVVLAIALTHGSRSLTDTLRRAPARTRALGVGVIAATWLVILLPGHETLLQDPALRVVEQRLREGSRLLRRVRPTLQPNAAVLSDWLWGHHVLYLANAPTVASPFILSGHDQANTEARMALLAETPERLLETMQRRGARYVLISDRFDPEREARSLGLPAPTRSMATRLLGTGPAPSGLALIAAEGGVRLFERSNGSTR